MRECKVTGVKTGAVPTRTTTASSVIRVRGEGGVGVSGLTVADGFTNLGVIELTDQDAGFGAALTVTSGTLVNAAGATITALAGALGPRTLNAEVANAGTLVVDRALAMNRGSSGHTNTGTIHLRGGDLTL